MKSRFLFLTFVIFLLFASFAFAADKYKMDEATKTQFSKYFTYNVNKDGGLNLYRTIRGKTISYGNLTGAITIKGTDIFVKNGQFEMWDGIHYIIVKDEFKIDIKRNELAVWYKEGGSAYIEQNDYQLRCLKTKKCEVRISMDKGHNITVLRGVAKFSTAVENLNKRVKNTRNQRRANPKYMSQLIINASNVILQVLDTKEHLIRIFDVDVNKPFTSKFGFPFAFATNMTMRIEYKSPSKFTLWVSAPILHMIQKSKLEIDHAKYYFYDHDLIFVAGQFIGYHVGEKGLADFYGSPISFINSNEGYERCISLYDNRNNVTCVYYDETKNILRINQRGSVVTKGLIAPLKHNTWIIINPMTKGSSFEITNGKSQSLIADYNALKLKNTRDWKDIGVSFTIFILNENLSNLSKLQQFWTHDRIECNLQTGKCNLNDKSIYDVVKKLRCNNDADCTEGRKCINQRCVVPKKCEPLYVNRGSKIDLLVVGHNYESKAAALADAKKVIDYNGQNKGLFYYEPLKSYKNYFSIYFYESALTHANGYDEWFRYDVKSAEKACGGSKYVVVLDKSSAACRDYCPYSDMSHVQIPMKRSVFDNALPSILVHEMGHKWGLLDDEYYFSTVTPIDPRKFRFRRIAINALNCVYCHRGYGTGLTPHKDAWLMSNQFRSCGAYCSGCSSWCRPSDNSVMNNKNDKPDFFKFNEPSIRQYTYFIKRMLGLPKDQNDKEVEKWFGIAKYGIGSTPIGTP